MEPKYYLAHYTDINGDNTKGQWSLTEEDMNDEITRMEKVPHLQMRHSNTLSVDQKQVKDLAKANNMTVQDILQHV